MNLIFWHEIPYRVLRKAEAGRGQGLTFDVKDDAGEEIYSVGFAGSLIDRHFRTAEKSAKEINKAKKKMKHKAGEDTVMRNGIIRDSVIELFVAVALLLAVCSLFIS